MVDERSALTDVAFAVCTALHRASVEAVLVGGSAAVYYAPSVVQSLDADFVLRYGSSGRAVLKALAGIGFRRRPGGDFAHDRTAYTVEFPAGPPMIGSDLVTAWNTERRGDELLFVYTPTDVVRDRFLHHYAWPDPSAYKTAVNVARELRNRIDWDVFIAWARREAAHDRSYDVRELERFLREVGIGAG